MKPINKLVYDKTKKFPQVHVISIPASEHDYLYCGKEKKEVKSKDRAYRAKIEDLPSKFQHCEKCQKENRRRLAEMFNLPEWIDK